MAWGGQDSDHDPLSATGFATPCILEMVFRLSFYPLAFFLARQGGLPGCPVKEDGEPVLDRPGLFWG